MFESGSTLTSSPGAPLPNNTNRSHSSPHTHIRRIPYTTNAISIRRASALVGQRRCDAAGWRRGKENDVVWQWRWGPRAAAEIGEVAVGRSIAEFMAERASRGSAGRGAGPGRGASSGAGGEEGRDEELGRRRARAHREEAQKRLAALLKGFEHAAGGDLAGTTVVPHLISLSETK